MISMKLLQRGGITLVALAAFVLLVLALAVPWNAQAQQPATTLVSNQFAGNNGAFYITGDNIGGKKVGQRFHTGAGTTITLSYIDIYHYGESVAREHRNTRTFRVRFCGISSRAVSGVTYYRPNSTCTTLTPRAGHFGWTYFPIVIGQLDIPDHWDGYTRFNAPANTTFSANSNYFLVIDQFGSANSLKTTDSNAEDTATLTGWSIHNGLHHPIRGDWYARRSQLPTENLRISLSGSVATSQVAAPTIEGTPALSDAGSDGEWTSGEAVQVTVTFSEEVSVATTGGTPSIGIELGGTEVRSAPYVSGSGTTELVFRYTLTDADGSHSSMFVPENSLTLNGGTITSTSSGGDAALGHRGAARASTGGL